MNSGIYVDNCKLKVGEYMSEYFHSVTLDEEKCKGCTNCIKHCPTEAIRVRKGKARITAERCIDCGECIRICPHHAKKAITDSFDKINDFKYKVAVVAPSFYGQFKEVDSRVKILNAIKKCGFDEVFEVAKAAEMVTKATKVLLNDPNAKKPLISSACPAVVKLIQLRFPSLIENLVKLESPMELSAKLVREKAIKNGMQKDDIGVFFITPCPAKATSVKAPYGRSKSGVDGVISIKDIYLKVLSNLENNDDTSYNLSGFVGVRWASSGGESLALGTDKFLAVDGIHSVISILEEIENDRIEDVEFIEALACNGGCLGGVLTVENLYVAKTRIKKIIDEAKSMTSVEEIVNDENINLEWSENIEHKPILKLDCDFETAIKKLEELELINENLPGLDCGACGAPSCRALAEDIVRQQANETDCIFKLRDKVRSLAKQMMELEDKLPPVMDK